MAGSRGGDVGSAEGDARPGLGSADATVSSAEVCERLRVCEREGQGGGGGVEELETQTK